MSPYYLCHIVMSPNSSAHLYVIFPTRFSLSTVPSSPVNIVYTTNAQYKFVEVKILSVFT
jgi:hypothetical protein